MKKYLLLWMVFWAFCATAQEKGTYAPITFDHLYIVVPDTVYRKIVAHPFVLEMFANVDKGWPKFEPIDTAKKEAYFRFKDNYFELLSTANRWKEPIDKLGMGWISSRKDSADAIIGMLKKGYHGSAKMQEEKDQLGNVKSRSFYVQQDTLASLPAYWIQEYTSFFIRDVYGDQPEPLDLTAKSYRAAKYYAPNKAANSIAEIGLNMTRRETLKMKKWLQTIGYTVAEHQSNIRAQKDNLVIMIKISNKDQLAYLVISHNKNMSKQTIRFSEDCVLHVGKRKSIWRF
ncbi:hypothetical protein DBR32_03015 [Taibaiella sp. KBW10]|uniref:DUF5829 family protein n=1 Tax=Taibaiella sp. KBW10 TaxID=2153357 RepID=UPI000F5A25F3|nr:DUF5829 family protein [Taibaiella sp. KBW10]RQO32582.1 hypothetical protein DBR32_03015 [Taibaiella sp. KBW10]